MIENSQMMVRYDIWCQKCTHKNTKENDEPCDECLDNPVSENTERPIKFKEK